MHDTFLSVKICENLIKLCKENKISILKKVYITVDTESHITKETIYENIINYSNHPFGENTVITMEKKPLGKLNAFISRIEGE